MKKLLLLLGALLAVPHVNCQEVVTLPYIGEADFPRLVTLPGTTYPSYLDDLQTQAIKAPEGFTTFKIKSGRQNFRPNDGILPWSARKNQVSLSIAFHPSAYWSLVDWRYDGDYFDWNKGPGFTSFGIKRNNRNASFLAWRPSPVQSYHWQVAVFTNGNDRSWTISEFVTVRAGEVATVDMVLGKHSITFHLTDPDEEVTGSHPWRRPWIKKYRNAGTWIGGANNSEGPYGGRATQPIILYGLTCH